MAALYRLVLMLTLVFAAVTPMRPCHADVAAHPASMHMAHAAPGKAHPATGGAGCLVCGAVVADVTPDRGVAIAAAASTIALPVAPMTRLHGLTTAPTDPPPWHDA